MIKIAREMGFIKIHSGLLEEVFPNLPDLVVIDSPTPRRWAFEHLVKEINQTELKDTAMYQEWVKDYNYMFRFK